MWNSTNINDLFVLSIESSFPVLKLKRWDPLNWNDEAFYTVNPASIRDKQRGGHKERKHPRSYVHVCVRKGKKEAIKGQHRRRLLLLLFLSRNTRDARWTRNSNIELKDFKVHVLINFAWIISFNFHISLASFNKNSSFDVS